MKFTPPGGSLNWMTPLMCFAGVWLGVTEGVQGRPGFAALFATAGVAAALIWFRVRFAAKVLLLYLTIAIVASIWMTIEQGISLRRVVQLSGAVVLFWELVQWRRRIAQENREAAELRRWDEESGYGRIPQNTARPDFASNLR